MPVETIVTGAAPTRADVLARSRLLKANYEATATSPPDDLDVVLSDAVGIVARVTGRKLGTQEGVLVPPDLAVIAIRAVALKAAQLDVTSEAEAAESAAAGQGLRSITAGPWSETYLSPSELIARGNPDGVPPMDSDPRLAELLWLLATPEARGAWIEQSTGVVAPFSSVTEFDYGLQGPYFGGPFMGAGGPDGW